VRNPEAIASQSEVFQAAVVSAAVGVGLCFGFFSLSGRLAVVLRDRVGGSLPLWESGTYLGLCVLFAVLLPPAPKVRPRASLWISLPLPILLAFLFGFFDDFPGLTQGIPGDSRLLWALVWSLGLSPLGEELVFRSGVYRLVDFFYPNTMASFTNPLPLCVWGSAIAFSLWHLQNWDTLGAVKTLFQCGYTFPVGLWLGWLRWRTGSLKPPLAAHFSINLAAILG
jgi:membrane protease YdiL (CAAX protease family)